MGVLYIVSTPIGNLEDITLRAIRILKECSWIACEDTRRTRILLAKYGILTRVLSYRDQNKVQATGRILRVIANGGDVALVSDAGTPTLADPGLYLVRAAIERGIPVVPLPGPSIVLAPLVASGLQTVPFSFFGFLPPGPGRVRQLCETLRGRNETLIFLDSPRRLGRDLAVMAEVFGGRRAVVAREVTKIHEEFRRGTLISLAGYYGAEGPGPVKGEVVVLIEGRGERVIDEDDVMQYIRERIAGGGATSKGLCREVEEAFGLARNRAYRLVVLGLGRTKGG